MAKHVFHHLVFAGLRPHHRWEGSEPTAVGAQSSARASCRATSPQHKGAEQRDSAAASPGPARALENAHFLTWECWS